MALIQCLLGAASPVLSSQTYQFERDEHGRFVCEVFDLVHIQCLLSREDIYREVSATPPAPMKEHIETLLGSSVLPSMVPIADGFEVQLGDVVARAHKESGLSIAAWNEMPGADREAALALTIAVMKAEAAPPVPAPTPEPEAAPAPEAEQPAPAAEAAAEPEVEAAPEPEAEPTEPEPDEAPEQPAVDPVLGAVVTEVAAPAKAPRRGRRSR